jgi:hypothetical protein
METALFSPPIYLMAIKNADPDERAMKTVLFSTPRYLLAKKKQIRI